MKGGSDVATVEAQAIAPADDTARMMEIAIQQGEAGVAALERLVAMRERERDYQSELAFNAAMSAAEAEMSRISADANNPQTRSRYASYGKLDRALRPIYTRHGFALSFDTGDIIEETMPVRCYVTHALGHTRMYSIPMDVSGKGAKGGDVMTKTHARGSAATYGMRYLLKLIFNVAIGEEDDDGQAAGNVDPITDEQAATVQALIDAVQADKAGFLKYFKIESVSALPSNRYREAVAMLERKR